MRQQASRLQKFTRANFLFGKVGATEAQGLQARWEEKVKGTCASWAPAEYSERLKFLRLAENKWPWDPRKTAGLMDSRNEGILLKKFVQRFLQKSFQEVFKIFCHEYLQRVLGEFFQELLHYFFLKKIHSFPYNFPQNFL